MLRLVKSVAVAGALALTMSGSAFAQGKIEVQTSVPGLTFTFFVHMMNAMKEAVIAQGGTPIESDGQVSSPKQTADVEAAISRGVKGIIISPNEVDAMAPAIQEAVDAGIPVVTVDRRVASVNGILAHV